MIDEFSRSQKAPDRPGTGVGFPATRWSLIVGLAEGSEDERREAMEELCRSYWFPLYAFARHQGHSRHNAEDLTQGFFAHLLSKNRLSYLQGAEGRLRTYLLGAMKRFITDEWRAASAQKRGGGRNIISLDSCAADGRYLEIADEGGTPEDIFHQQWVLSLLTKARDRVKQAYSATDKARLFAAIEPAITDSDNIDYDALSVSLDMSPGAIRTAIHRLRRRFGDAIRQEIAETVADSEEAATEYQELLAHG
ncbi:MAG: sigma-70 family RNA polymerase sigma factor [Verrucomicrobiae bacterium]|nr:sigma-70 family RNA polymerase sigma factor [Verrucomicrobiae bacterium]